MGANQSSNKENETHTQQVSFTAEEKCRNDGGKWIKGSFFSKDKCTKPDSQVISEEINQDNLGRDRSEFKPSTVNYGIPESTNSSEKANDLEIDKLEAENKRLEAEIKALEQKSQLVDNAEKKLREQTAGYKRLYVKKIKKLNKSNKTKLKNKSNKKRVNKKKNKSKKKINKRK